MATVTMTSKSEVTIRCFQPGDSVRCRTMFAEGIGELRIAVMKKFFLVFLKVTAILLVPGTAIAVKWSVWTLLAAYFVAFVVMTVATYINVNMSVMDYINSNLKSDLLDIEKYYDGHDSCMFVAKCDGRVIGMVAVDTKKDNHPGVARLRRMSVCSSARRKGIGKILLNKAIKYCKEKKYNKIVLCVTQDYSYAAVELYKKHDFKVVNSKLYLQFLLFDVYDLYFEKYVHVDKEERAGLVQKLNLN